MINVDRVIADQLPSLNKNAFTKKPIKAILSNLLHEKDLSNFVIQAFFKRPNKT